MIKCKKCGKIEWFAFLNQGFCKECKEQIYEYQFQMPNWLKNANQLMEEWNASCSPDAFFVKYELLCKELTRLTENENEVQFKNQKPSEMKKQVESSIHSRMNEMIHRFYENSFETKEDWMELEKKKRLAETFYHSFDPYLNQMNRINQNTVKRLYLALLEEKKSGGNENEGK